MCTIPTTFGNTLCFLVCIKIYALVISNQQYHFLGGYFSMKDEAAGEVPVAFVVRANGSKITEDEIKQYISKQVLINIL